jgi:hypothetical protein
MVVVGFTRSRFFRGQPFVDHLNAYVVTVFKLAGKLSGGYAHVAFTVVHVQRQANQGVRGTPGFKQLIQDRPLWLACFCFNGG